MEASSTAEARRHEKSTAAYVAMIHPHERRQATIHFDQLEKHKTDASIVTNLIKKGSDELKDKVHEHIKAEDELKDKVREHIKAESDSYSDART